MIGKSVFTKDFYFGRYSHLVRERLLGNQTKLYEHQQKALLKISDKAARGDLDPTKRSTTSGAGFLALGVGTGKSAVISCLPYVLAPYMTGPQVLIVVDNCTLRSRILQDFPTDARHCPLYDQWPLYSLGVLLPGVPPPQIAELRAEDWRSYAFSLDKADLLVVNRQFLLNLVNRGDIDPANVGLIICDEAHHAWANSYKTIFSYFDRSMLVFLSGSRFRTDSKPLPYIRYETVEDENEFGFSILRYSPVADFEFLIQDAWKLDPPPIKRLIYKEATSQAFLVEEADGTEVEYTPEAFFAKAESDREWFRAILLADKFCLPVLEQAVSILAQKRRSGQPHKMIVRGVNIRHAHRLYKLLEAFPLLTGRVGLVHSDKEGFDLAGRPSETYKKFFGGDYICLVHCSMVGEGFNHSWASVSVPLCVMRSHTVAEQEFGRIIRRVPGRSPGQFPDLAHENWGVVVTHEMLAIRDLFEKFIQGVRLAPLSGYEEGESLEDFRETEIEKPQLNREYSAGETVLALNSTRSLSSGDVIVFSVPVDVPTAMLPKFDIVEELRSTGSLSFDPALSEVVENPPGTVNKVEPLQQLQLDLFEKANPKAACSVPGSEPEPEPSTSDRAVDAIAEHLHSLRSTRTVSVIVESILDDERVQISPAWIDLPAGTDVLKKPVRKELTQTEANFIDHIGLDWSVLHEGQLIKFSDYRKRAVVKKHNLDLDAEGEIVTSQGMRLRDVMPASAYEIFLKGLQTELEQAEIEIPHPSVPCRPDEIKRSLQEKYGKRIRACIFDFLDSSWLVPDGRMGRSLITKPPLSIEPLMSGNNDDGMLVSFNYQNNTHLLHKVVFAYVKQVTGKKWGMHESEADYLQAEKIAKDYLSLIKGEIQDKRANDSNPKIVYLHSHTRKPEAKESNKRSEPGKLANFFIILGNQDGDYLLEPLMEIPLPLAEYILRSCGIAKNLDVKLKLDKSIVPGLRQLYSSIAKKPEMIESIPILRLADSTLLYELVLQYIVVLGKALQDYEILVHSTVDS